MEYLAVNTIIMKYKSLLLFLLLFGNLFSANAERKMLHIYVALCDNWNQGIVPVPAAIGNGQNPRTNLYWGAGYGVKHFFDKKTDDWTLLEVSTPADKNILQRLLFKHKTEDAYLLAEAYDGAKIKACITDFLLASNGQNEVKISYKEETLRFGGKADLLAYVGHDGLMEFSVFPSYKDITGKKKDVMILACYSKEYFAGHIESAQANPILWTTHLMAPEAYTLKAALDGWLLNETGKQIDERAAVTYDKYQKCGLRGARNLFTTGF